MGKVVTGLAGLTLLFCAGAYADNENIYCGKGSEWYSVDDARIALVVQDGDAKLFFDGKDFSEKYKISKTAEGYQALEKNPSRNNPGPNIAFKTCGDSNTTTAHFIGGMVSNEPFPCTCETE